MALKRRRSKVAKRKSTIKKTVKKAVKKAPALKLTSLAKAKKSFKRLTKKQKGFISAITEPKHRKANVRLGPKAMIPVTDAKYLARRQAKKLGGKSFRPRLYFYKGKLFASPRSDASRQSYLVNPNKGQKMARRKKRVLSNPRRRKHYRRNPSPMAAVTNKTAIVSVLTLGAGFIGGLKAQKYLHGIGFTQSWRKFNGIIPMALGILLAAKGKKEIAKKLGMGIAISGAYDLLSQNIPQLALMPVEGVDLEGAQTYDAPQMGAQTYDAPQMGADTMVLGNTEIVGEDQPGAGMYAF